MLAIDANFKLKQKNKHTTDDQPLTKDYAYMVDGQKLDAHIKAAPSELATKVRKNSKDFEWERYMTTTETSMQHSVQSH